MGPKKRSTLLAERQLACFFYFRKEVNYLKLDYKLPIDYPKYFKGRRPYLNQ